MPIQKPFAVVPLPLGVHSTGNEVAGRPASHLGEFPDMGMKWGSSNDTNLWVKGNFGSANPVNFMAMLGTNATATTRVRLRLGDTETGVDSSVAQGVVTSATYSASSAVAGHGGSLTSNGAGLRDGNMTDDFPTSHRTNGGVGEFIQIDLGSAQTLQTVSIAGANNAVYLNNCVIEGATTLGTWTTIQTLGTIALSTLYNYPINASYRYIRVRQTAAAQLWVSEFYVTTAGSAYDSGATAIRTPAIVREDGEYHSFLQLPTEITAQWWRIDIDLHSGPFEAMALVLGKQIEFSNYYTPENTSFGQEDYGTLEFGRFGVNDETPGIKLRILEMDFGWMIDTDRFTKFQPLRDKIGTTGMCYWCFDPEPTVQRQDKQYFGPLMKPTFFKPSVFDQSRWSSQFQIRSII